MQVASRAISLSARLNTTPPRLIPSVARVVSLPQRRIRRQLPPSPAHQDAPGQVRRRQVGEDPQEHLAGKTADVRPAEASASRWPFRFYSICRVFHVVDLRAIPPRKMLVSYAKKRVTSSISFPQGQQPVVSRKQSIIHLLISAHSRSPALPCDADAIMVSQVSYLGSSSACDGRDNISATTCKARSSVRGMTTNVVSPARPQLKRYVMASATYMSCICTYRNNSLPSTLIDLCARVRVRFCCGGTAIMVQRCCSVTLVL